MENWLPEENKYFDWKGMENWLHDSHEIFINRKLLTEEEVIILNNMIKELLSRISMREARDNELQGNEIK